MLYPISLDTALSIVGSMKVRKIKEIDSVNDFSKKQEIEREIDMYIKEEEMLYSSNELEKLSIMDKVVRLYSFILKGENDRITS